MSRKILAALLASLFLSQACAQAPPTPAVATQQPQPVTFSAQNLFIAPYPLNAVPVQASGTGTTAAINLSLPGASGKTTYLCGFSYWTSATAATFGTLTVTNIQTTMSFEQPVGAIPAVLELSKTFSPCIPASAANTAVNINGVAPGTGGVGTAAAWGYQD